jgi:hypothetical protein
MAIDIEEVSFYLQISEKPSPCRYANKEGTSRET